MFGGFSKIKGHKLITVFPLDFNRYENVARFVVYSEN